MGISICLIEVTLEGSTTKSAHEASTALNEIYYLACRGLGCALHHTGSPRAAIDAFKESLRIKDDIMTHYELGQVYEDLHDGRNMLSCMSRAAVLDPTYASAWHGVANAYALCMEAMTMEELLKWLRLREKADEKALQLD